VAFITYHGKPGQNGELEKQKALALELQNRLTRLKVEKLEGQLVAKREVEFLVGNASAVFRRKVLDLPTRLVADLRSFGLDNSRLHDIRARLGESVHRFLYELIGELEAAVDPDAALARLNEDDPEVEDNRAQTARELKHEALNERRRKKRAARAAKGDP
jgi:hypothetical protein